MAMRLTPELHKPGLRCIVAEADCWNAIFYWAKFEVTILEWSPSGMVKLRIEKNGLEKWYKKPPKVHDILPEKPQLKGDDRKEGFGFCPRCGFRFYIPYPFWGEQPKEGSHVGS